MDVMRYAGIDVGLGDTSPIAVAILDIKPDAKPGDFPVLVAMKDFWLQDVPDFVQGDSYSWHRKIHKITWEVEKWLDQFPVETLLDCGIEFAHNRKNPQVALELAGAWGMIASRIWSRCIRVHLIQPAEGKESLTADGKADGKKMVEFARQMFGVPMSVHQAHACGIAIATRQKGLR